MGNKTNDQWIKSNQCHKVRRDSLKLIFLIYGSYLLASNIPYVMACL